MKHSRPLISLLLTATVLVDLVAVSLVGFDAWELRVWPDPTLGALYALTFSQASLAAIWAALSTASAPWRLTGGFLVLALWSLGLAALSGGAPGLRDSTECVVLLLAQAVLIFVPLWGVRAKHFRLATAFQLPAISTGDAASRPLQFSLGYLLAWMTAVAALLGLWQYTVRYDLLPRIAAHWAEGGLLALAHTAIALASLWAVLGNRRGPWRPMTLCLVTGAVISRF